MAIPDFQKIMLRLLAGAAQVEEVWFTPELVVRESSAGPPRR